jgi:hypothetical protein
MTPTQGAIDARGSSEQPAETHTMASQVAALRERSIGKIKPLFTPSPPARGASAPLPPAGAAAARGGSGWGGSGTTARDDCSGWADSTR